MILTLIVSLAAVFGFFVLGIGVGASIERYRWTSVKDPRVVELDDDWLVCHQSGIPDLKKLVAADLVGSQDAKIRDLKIHAN